MAGFYVMIIIVRYGHSGQVLLLDVWMLNINQIQTLILESLIAHISCIGVLLMHRTIIDSGMRVDLVLGAGGL